MAISIWVKIIVLKQFILTELLEHATHDQIMCIDHVEMK